MRNFVAKHDFNRATVHKTAKDYQRLSKKEVMDAFYDEEDKPWWLVDEDEVLDGLIFTDPKQWESINETAHQ